MYVRAKKTMKFFLVVRHTQGKKNLGLSLERGFWMLQPLRAFGCPE